MVISSFSPIRRFRISSLPLAISKTQPSPFLITGMGKGQSLLADHQDHVGALLNEPVLFVIGFYKARASLLSSIGSPEKISSCAPGPKIANISLSSLLFAAAMSALTASSADANVFGCAAAAWDTSPRPKIAMNSAAKTTRIPCQMDQFLSLFEISCHPPSNERRVRVPVSRQPPLDTAYPPPPPPPSSPPPPDPPPRRRLHHRCSTCSRYLAGSRSLPRLPPPLTP